MELHEFKVTRFLCGRLDYGTDLYQSIQSYCEERQIRQAWIHAFGAVSNLAILYYDQERETYLECGVNDKLEILTCAGNISLKEDRPFLHMHITCSNREGKVWGGQLTQGTRVFACEAAVWVLEGSRELKRELDPPTGLHLWYPPSGR